MRLMVVAIVNSVARHIRCKKSHHLQERSGKAGLIIGAIV